MNTLSNAGWLTAARLCGDLAGFLLFVLLSRHFGPAGIGLYAYGFAVSSLIYAVIHLGFEDYALRECCTLSPVSRTVLIGKLAGTQSIIALFVFAGLLIFLFSAQQGAESNIIILLFSIYQLMFAVSRTLFTPALSQQAMVEPAIAELLCRVGTLLICIVLILSFQASLPIILSPFPLGGIAFLLLALVSAKRHNGAVVIKFSWKDVIQIIRLTWPFASSVIVFYLYARSDLIMLAFLLGNESAGIYATSLKFMEVAIVPIFFYGLATYPILSKNYEKSGSDFSINIDRFLETTLIIGLFIAWAMFFILPVILVLILGNRFAPAIPLVKLMSVSCIMMAIDVVFVRLLIVTHLQIERVKYQFYGTLSNILFNLLLIPLMRTMGATIALILAQALTNILYGRILKQKGFIKDTTTTVLVSFSSSLALMLLGGILSKYLYSEEWFSASLSLMVFLAAIMSLRRGRHIQRSSPT